MNMIKRHKILASVVALVVVIIAVIVGTSGGGSNNAPATVKPPITHSAPHVMKPKPPTNERKDLNYFNLDDKSVAGFTNIYVKWSVTNHSSKTSDYEIQWEAVNSSGVRVANGDELSTNVQPGQTAKGSDPTTLDTTHVKIVVTKFDRTESF